tara:strand:- start:52 stop:579 length:528 start_codon:yes stop_codon:yes gene_type:complete
MKMNIKLFNNFYKRILISSPIITSFIFCIIDSTPFYFVDFISVKTQMGLIVVYSWICCDHHKLRPLFILFFGIVIDLFNNSYFGFTSLSLLFLFLLQRKEMENLLDKSFIVTWTKFSFYFILYNLLNILILRFFSGVIKFDIIEIIFTVLITIVIFPLIFSLVNKINEKIKYYNE